MFNIPEDQIGVAVGSVQGVFSFCQFLSGFYIGHITDRYGRRPMLLFGIMVAFFCTLLFGFAPTLTIALVLRGLSGLLTSTQGTGKVGRVLLVEVSCWLCSNKIYIPYLISCYYNVYIPL